MIAQNAYTKVYRVEKMFTLNQGSLFFFFALFVLAHKFFSIQSSAPARASLINSSSAIPQLHSRFADVKTFNKCRTCTEVKNRFSSFLFYAITIKIHYSMPAFWRLKCVKCFFSSLSHASVKMLVHKWKAVDFFFLLSRVSERICDFGRKI